MIKIKYKMRDRSVMLNCDSLHIGSKAKIPTMPDGRVYDGEVIYINKEHGYCRLKFITEHRREFIESYKLYNILHNKE